MTTTIRQSTQLSASEQHELFEWGDDIFGLARYGITFRPESLHLLLSDDAKPVSHVGLIRETIEVDAMPFNVGGVCSVVTVPQQRGKGYAGRLLEHANSLFADWKVDCGVLFCVPELVPFYQRLGWHVLDARIFMRQPAGVVESPIPVMFFPVGRAPGSATRVYIDGLPW